MKQFLAKAILTAAVITGTLSGLTSFAAAQSMDIYVGPGHHRPPPPGFDAPPPPPPGFRGRGCDPRQAEGIAHDYGLRRAHVVDVTPRRVVVNGFGRRGPDTMIFANVRGCPMMGR